MTDILSAIGRTLNLDDMIHLSNTSKYIYRLTNTLFRNNVYWINLIQRDFPELLTPNVNPVLLYLILYDHTVGHRSLINSIVKYIPYYDDETLMRVSDCLFKTFSFNVLDRISNDRLSMLYNSISFVNYLLDVWRLNAYFLLAQTIDCQPILLIL
jgi:hypothetical protein